eukprot:6076864-Prorocentrum_lima.AAC.1
MEQAHLEGTYALGEQLPIPPQASKLESIAREDIFDCIPNPIMRIVHISWVPDVNSKDNDINNAYTGFVDEHCPSTPTT